MTRHPARVPEHLLEGYTYAIDLLIKWSGEELAKMIITPDEAEQSDRLNTAEAYTIAATRLSSSV